jgi:hypothetical protein
MVLSRLGVLTRLGNPRGPTSYSLKEVIFPFSADVTLTVPALLERLLYVGRVPASHPP